MSRKRLKERVSMSARVGMNESEGKKIIVPVIWRKGKNNLLTVTERYALIVSENAGPDLMLYAAGRYIARKAAGELKRSYVNVGESYVVPGIDSVLIMLKAGGLERRAYELELMEEYEDSDGVLWVLEAKEISLDEFMRRHEHRVKAGGASGGRPGAQAGEGLGGAEDVRGGEAEGAASGEELVRPGALPAYEGGRGAEHGVDGGGDSGGGADTGGRHEEAGHTAEGGDLAEEGEEGGADEGDGEEGGEDADIQGGEGDGLEAGEGYERDSDSDEMGEG
jgi:hypothetical protein